MLWLFQNTTPSPFIQEDDLLEESTKVDYQQYATFVFLDAPPVKRQGYLSFVRAHA